MGSMEQEKFVFIKKWSFYSFSVKPNPFFLQINWLMLKKIQHPAPPLLCLSGYYESKCYSSNKKGLIYMQFFQAQVYPQKLLTAPTVGVNGGSEQTLNKHPPYLSSNN